MYPSLIQWIDWGGLEKREINPNGPVVIGVCHKPCISALILWSHGPLILMNLDDRIFYKNFLSINTIFVHRGVEAMA